ncbi:MAG: hypothetical protein AB8B97_18565 [Granulosicoccus sp.]
MGKALLCAARASLIVSCSESTTPPPPNDDGTESDDDTTLPGIFVDSPVEGHTTLAYATATQSGYTSASGEFRYLAGERITFSIGFATLPTVVAAKILSPIEMGSTTSAGATTAANVASLLQSLDQDGNLDNGIFIPVATEESAQYIDFNVSMFEFRNNETVINMVANSGSSTTTLVSGEDALIRLITRLDELPGYNNPSSFWLSAENYQSELDRQLNNSYYPIIVQGRCRNEVPEFRGTFIEFPYIRGNVVTSSSALTVFPGQIWCLTIVSTTKPSAICRDRVQLHGKSKNTIPQTYCLLF